MTHLYEPSAWMILPFVALLGMIALGPLFFESWWGKHYPKVSLSLAAITLCYYLFILPAAARHTAAHTGLEYVSFILLIGSLFVVSGGIHINVKGEATPLANVLFLFTGAALANVLGTTGASMLLIRPWLRVNKYRVTAHHVVFFILIVSNVGGCLTPIGDPPLFLGYLKGVPFWWVMKACWPIWLFGICFLLAVFFVIDRENFLRAPKQVRESQTENEQWRFDGLHNLLFLVLILIAVFIQKPFFVREILMLAAAIGSWLTTRKDVYAANGFNFHPIKEVAILFIGIFSTMMPALDFLQLHAGAIAKSGVGFFYWGSGVLSSVLDNAPTYLAFLKASTGAFVDDATVTQVRDLLSSHGANLASATDSARHTYAALEKYFQVALSAKEVTREQIEIAFLLGNEKFNAFIVAISVGSVFFGANTYIGNGPNFMVKSIADHQKVNTPGFIGYIIRYTLPVMLPMLFLVWFFFFRR